MVDLYSQAILMVDMNLITQSAQMGDLVQMVDLDFSPAVLIRDHVPMVDLGPMGELAPSFPAVLMVDLDSSPL
jgi:hypothetical protein